MYQVRFITRSFFSTPSLNLFLLSLFADFFFFFAFSPKLAEVARTPWLDPCVAGVILSVKALSEGDWRLGKGALAGWADQALRAMSESGAKVLRLSSGDEVGPSRRY